MSIYDNGYNIFLEKDSLPILVLPDNYQGGLTDINSVIVSPSSLTSGSLFSQITLSGQNPFIAAGKTKFDNTETGWIIGIDSNTPKLFIGNTSEYLNWDGALIIAGTVVASNIHIPDVNTTTNSFHVNSSGNTWWGATETNFNANNDNAKAYILSTGIAKFQQVTITGASSIVNGSAVVGGWIAGDTTLTNTSGGNTVTLSTGTNALIAGPTGSPTFTLTTAGAITATSGTIAAWTLGATTFTGGNATLDSAGDFTLGTANNVVRLSATDATYRIWAGHATASAAPFSVTQGGILRATNAKEIVLTVADGGNVVGLIVTQNDTTNNPVAVSITQNAANDVLNLYDGAVNVLKVADGGNMIIGDGTAYGNVRFVISGSTGDNDSTFLTVRRDQANRPVFAILPWTSSTFLSTGVYYSNGTWTHAFDGTTSNVLALIPGTGASWYASANSSATWGVANNVTLWNDSASWVSLVQSSKAGANSFNNANTATDILTITGNSLTTGSLTVFTSNSANTSARALIEIINDNALATGAYNLLLQQDGGGAHLVMTGDPSTALTIDGGLQFDGTFLNFYNGSFTFRLNSASSSGINQVLMGLYTATNSVTGNDTYVFVVNTGGTLLRYKISYNALIPENRVNTSSSETLTGYSSITNATADSTYVYFWGTFSGTNRLARYTISDGTLTNMTFSGTAPDNDSANSITLLGGNMYIADLNTTTIRKYTISGTTATYSSAITAPATLYNGGVGNSILWNDGTYLYFLSTATVTLYKINISGTTQKSQAIFSSDTFNYYQGGWVSNSIPQLAHHLVDSGGNGSIKILPFIFE